jgi:hypothetical protein
VARVRDEAEARSEAEPDRVHVFESFAGFAETVAGGRLPQAAE